MARTLSANLSAALDNDVLSVFYAVDFAFDSGNLRLITLPYDATLGGKLYTGAGDILNISPVEETSELRAASLKVTISGIESSQISLALSETYLNRVGQFYFGVEDNSGNFVMDEIFSGYISEMNISDTGTTATIEVVVESKLVRLESAKLTRYNDEEQQNTYPGDLGFEFVQSLDKKENVWGR